MKKIKVHPAALATNFAIIILEAYSLSISANNYGWRLFMYFTEYSNTLALISSVAFLICAILNQSPNWLHYLKLFTSICLSITFLVVVFLLCPLAGQMGTSFILFYSSMFYHHLLCPLVFIFSHLVLEPKFSYPPKAYFSALIPVGLYAAIILTLNLIKALIGPYQFLHIYEQSIWITLGACIGIALITLGLGKLFCKIKSPRGS